MNDLSIFFYLASVMPNLGVFAGISSVVLGFVLALCSFIFFVSKAHNDDTTASACFDVMKFSFWLFPICSLVAILSPDKQTIYMIAASEMGEVAVQSEEAKDLYQDLRTIISRYADNPAN